MQSSRVSGSSSSDSARQPRNQLHVNRDHVLPFLKRLARRDACARRQVGDVRGPGGWHIVSVPTSRDRSALHGRETTICAASEDAGKSRSKKNGSSSGGWSSDLVQHALSEGLVELRDDVVRLSSSGAAYLRRRASQVEDSYSAQHQVRSRRDLKQGVNVTINECESPLGWLRNRKDRRTGKALISHNQFEAGERLRQDYFKAQMCARVTADWSCALSGGRTRRSAGDDRVDISDAAISAKVRFYKALDGVGEELSDVLLWVCCEGKGLRDVEQAAGWPQRSGKLMLQMALRALARHYGLEPSRTRHSVSRQSASHWGAEDYRPSLSDE